MIQDRRYGRPSRATTARPKKARSPSSVAKTSARRTVVAHKLTYGEAAPVLATAAHHLGFADSRSETLDRRESAA